MFSVVADVDNYKVFLPWCHESKYLRKGSTNSIAKLSIGFPPLLETYTALVWTKPPFVLKVGLYNNDIIFWNILASESGSPPCKTFS